MKILWREIWQNLKGSLLFDGLIMLQFVVFFWIVTQIIGYYVNLNSDSWVQTVKGDYRYYSLALNDAESSFSAMNQARQDPLYLTNAKEALREVRAQDGFNYLVATKESAYKVSVPELEEHFAGDSYQDFLDGSLYPGYYDRNFSLPPPEKEELFGTQVISLSFASLDWNAVCHYHLQAMKGRVFREEDFTVQAGTKEFPVMLGAAYEPYFEVGDRIHFYYTEEYAAVVIGFLKEDSMIITEESKEQDSYPTSMDYDVILPVLDFEGEISSGEYRSFAVENYTRALLGILVMEQDATGSESLDAQKEVNEIYRANNLFTVVPVSASDSIYLFQSETKNTVAMITALVAATAFFNIFSLCLCVTNKIHKNLKRYGIELMNGQRLYVIMAAFMAEIAMVIGAAAVIVIVLRWNTFYYNPKYFLAVLLPAALLLLMSCGVLAGRLSGVNIEEVIRRKDG